MLFSNFTDSDIIRTCAQWVIVQCGGSGTNGKKTSIGWPLMGLILPLLLMRKKRSGKDYIKNWIWQKRKSTNTWVDLLSYLGRVFIFLKFLCVGYNRIYLYCNNVGRGWAIFVALVDHYHQIGIITPYVYNTRFFKEWEIWESSRYYRHSPVMCRELLPDFFQMLIWRRSIRGINSKINIAGTIKIIYLYLTFSSGYCLNNSL